MSAPEFRTVPFRAVWQRIEQDIETAKEQAVALIDDVPARIAHRIGFVAGLRRAGQVLQEVERSLMGDSK